MGDLFPTGGADGELSFRNLVVTTADGLIAIVAAGQRRLHMIGTVEAAFDRESTADMLLAHGADKVLICGKRIQAKEDQAEDGPQTHIHQISIFNVAAAAPQQNNHREETAHDTPKPVGQKEGARHVGNVGRGAGAGLLSEEVVGSGEHRKPQLNTDENHERLKFRAVPFAGQKEQKSAQSDGEDEGPDASGSEHSRNEETKAEDSGRRFQLTVAASGRPEQERGSAGRTDESTGGYGASGESSEVPERACDSGPVPVDNEFGKVPSHQNGGEAMAHFVGECGKENKYTAHDPDDRKIGKVHQGKRHHCGYNENLNSLHICNNILFLGKQLIRPRVPSGERFLNAFQ